MTRWTAAGALSLALAACTPTPPTDSACLWARPISYDSRADSAQTVAEIRGFNEALYRVCPELRPK